MPPRKLVEFPLFPEGSDSRPHGKTKVASTSADARSVVDCFPSALSVPIPSPPVLPVCVQRNLLSRKSSRPVCTKDITPSKNKVCLPAIVSSSSFTLPDPPVSVTEPVLDPPVVDSTVSPLPFGQSLPLLNLSEASTPPVSSAPVPSSS